MDGAWFPHAKPSQTHPPHPDPLPSLPQEEQQPEQQQQAVVHQPQRSLDQLVGLRAGWSIYIGGHLCLGIIW